MYRGYVKLWRKIRDSGIMIKEGLLQLFIYILINARSTKGKSFGVELQPGQLITGRNKLAADLRQKPSTIYKRLKILSSKKYQLIEQESNIHYTVITVLNWTTYQDEVAAKEQEGSRSGNNKVALNKNEKNVIYVPTAEKLREKILVASPEAKQTDSDILNWANEIRLMVEIDKRTVEQINRMIDGVFKDTFWCRNIRSAGKLRKQWNEGKLSRCVKEKKQPRAYIP